MREHQQRIVRKPETSNLESKEVHRKEKKLGCLQINFVFSNVIVPNVYIILQQQWGKD